MCTILSSRPIIKSPKVKRGWDKEKDVIIYTQENTQSTYIYVKVYYSPMASSPFGSYDKFDFWISKMFKKVDRSKATRGRTKTKCLSCIIISGKRSFSPRDANVSISYQRHVQYDTPTLIDCCPVDWVPEIHTEWGIVDFKWSLPIFFLLFLFVNGCARELFWVSVFPTGGLGLSLVKNFFSLGKSHWVCL